MSQAFLKVVSGPRQGVNVPLEADKPLIIGRKRGDLLLEDPMVSATHAQIVPRDDGWVFQDLGSTNGSLVDGRLVREEVLRPGAEVAIGNTRMVLFVGLPENSQDDGGVVRANHLEIAWLLDEEQVEAPAAEARNAADVIDLNLRLPPGLNAVAEVIAGQDTGKVYRFIRGSMAMGRKLGEIPLSDLEVSRRHAVIEVFGRDMLFVRDLGSTNGTYHNGRRVSVARLRNGDTVGVGKTVLRVQINAG